MAQQFPVFKIKEKMGLPDPHMPPGRLHHALFVETDRDKETGVLYHVIGDVTSSQGMTYQSRTSQHPRNIEGFHSEELLGYTNPVFKPEQWDTVLGALPTPPQQKAANPSRQGRVEPFKEKLAGNRYRFYEDGDERRPLWKCTEWVEFYAIPALRQHRLVVQDNGPDEKAQIPHDK